MALMLRTTAPLGPAFQRIGPTTLPCAFHDPAEPPTRGNAEAEHREA